MQNKIKELELDLKELLFLLEEIKKRPEIVAIARRHISRLAGSLDELQSELEQMQHSDSRYSVENPVVGNDKSTEEQDTPEPSATLPDEEPNGATVISVAVLGEQLKPSGELIESFSLNDTFRFSRELFGGDTEKMNRTLQEIARMNILDDVVSHLSSQTMWDEENEATKDFVELLKKYFV